MKEELQNTTDRKLLPYKHYECFGLRMMGLKEEQIAERVGYSNQYVRYLFSRNGSLYQFWRTWVEERKLEKVDEALDIMFEHLPDAARANVVDSKMTDSMVAIMARRFIFDYTMGKPVERIAIKGDINLTTTDLVSKVMQRRRQQQDDAARGRSTSAGVAS